MRPIGTATLLLALAAAPVLTGCGSDSGDADEVPTITTRPSTSAASTPTAVGSTATTEPTTEPTPTAAATPTESAGPSPEPPADDPVGPTTYREAVALTRGSPIATPVERFSIDDGLIYCLLDDPVIGPSCELSRGFVKDAKVCGGAAEGVGRIETFEGRARPVCPTDTIREPGAEDVLGDGVVTDGAGIRCLVGIGRAAVSAVTCVDTGARTGFFLAPGEYHVF